MSIPQEHINQPAPNTQLRNRVLTTTLAHHPNSPTITQPGEFNENTIDHHWC